MTVSSEHAYDFVIVGSGAASVCAALVAKAAGKRALILEKTDKIGGSTALSGGVLWIPNNPVMKRMGAPDSYDEAYRYLEACAGDAGPGSSPARMEAFLTEGPKMVSFLEDHGMKFTYSAGWPDYHVGAKPGGHPSGRSLEAKIFNLRGLGDWRHRLRRHFGIRALPLSTPDIAQIYLGMRTFKSLRTHVALVFRVAQKAIGRELVRRGAALQGRLMKIAKENGVELWLDTGVEELITSGGRVTGVRASQQGRELRISARDGVLINAGGFSHNLQMREQFQAKPTSVDWTFANPGDTGEMIARGMELGADVALMDLAWWNTVSVLPGGALAMVLLDIAKPHAILVDASARRFVNEATSYVEVGVASYRRNREVQAVPAWVVFDDEHRRKYRFAGAPPGKTPTEWVETGYLKKADTIEELARQCGLDAAVLRETIERFNENARKGEDPEFQRGLSAYDGFYGDPTNRPNPTLGPIETAPFYAAQVVPGDVGTSGGLVTDEFARVLRKDGSPIEGLYATGNSTAPVFGRSYPGAGASIGASMVFGYIAARHALCRSAKREM